MKVTEHLDRATEPLISYEIIPPKRGGDIDGVFHTVESIMPFHPPFIDVTSHAAELELEKQDNGVFRRKVKRKRPGTIGMCAAIKHRFQVDAVPHVLCNGFSRQETEDALIEMNYLGIDNIMALRGDETNYQKELREGRTRNDYAVDLVRQVRDMNQGKYLEDLADAVPTNFCIGVAGYPEKHFEAPNLDWDIKKTKEKVDAGADYIVTQLFYDNEKFFAFRDLCREAGIQVPIIPGLKVLTSKRHLTFLPKFFHIDLPEDLSHSVESVPASKVSNVGIEWTINQSLELLEAGVPALHFYIMQSSTTITEVVKTLTDKKAIYPLSK